LPAYGKTLVLSGLALLSCLVLALGAAVCSATPSRRQQLLTGPLYVLTSAPSFVVAVVFAQAVNYTIYTYFDPALYETPPWYPIPIYTESMMPYLFAGFALVAGDGLFMDYLNAVRADLSGLRHAQFITAIRAKGAARWATSPATCSCRSSRATPPACPSCSAGWSSSNTSSPSTAAATCCSKPPASETSRWWSAFGALHRHHHRHQPRR
jgi:hypothetical protein